MNNRNAHTIGIVGAGAMGSLFAYFLHHNNKIVILENNKEIVNALKKGLTVEIDSKQYQFIPEISDDPAILTVADIIFIFTKSFATSDAIQNIKPHIKPDAIIVTLQNGIGNVEIIASIIHNPLVYGTTTIGATKVHPSLVRFGGKGSVIIGGDSSYHCSIVHSLLQEANLSVTIAPDPKRAIWEKAIINAAINPLGALLGLPNGHLIKSDYTLHIMYNIIAEAVAVATAHGINLDTDTMFETTVTVCRNTQNNFCSMLQDILAKRKTEIDSINGALILIAKQYTIDTPYNVTMFRLIKYKETQFI
ncbi:MAG: 2-dehydropantoate 2-reductase [Spirochaetes bacterium]|nr:2-dehydropantoate 2-reductase [Spirochaetota bacterium]